MTQPDDMSDHDPEPAIAAMMDRKAAATDGAGPYQPVGADAVRAGLDTFFRLRGLEITVASVSRMGGGASKEQYVVELEHDSGERRRYVLRLDALQGVMETDRRREFDVLRAIADHVAAPRAEWVDPTGATFGRPFLITSFVPGVAKPTNVVNESVSGLQTSLGAELRAALGPQFVSSLAAIHGVRLDPAVLGSLAIPDHDAHQAARWQVNWWSRVWADDRVAGHPLVALVERWLREHPPQHTDLVIVHGDYRTGNYLFNEETRSITAILDWELAHVGDYHEDLGWVVQRMYSTVEDGKRLVTGLMPREDFLASYEASSGRSVSPASLHYYEVLCAFKSTVATLASSVRAAADRHNHQDVLLSWLASCGYVFVAELCDLIERGPVR